jgi:hypothetical protein
VRRRLWSDRSGEHAPATRPRAAARHRVMQRATV